MAGKYGTLVHRWTREVICEATATQVAALVAGLHVYDERGRAIVDATLEGGEFEWTWVREPRYLIGWVVTHAPTGGVAIAHRRDDNWEVVSSEYEGGGVGIDAPPFGFFTHQGDWWVENKYEAEVGEFFVHLMNLCSENRCRFSEQEAVNHLLK